MNFCFVRCDFRIGCPLDFVGIVIQLSIRFCFAFMLLFSITFLMVNILRLPPESFCFMVIQTRLVQLPPLVVFSKWLKKFEERLYKVSVCTKSLLAWIWWIFRVFSWTNSWRIRASQEPSLFKGSYHIIVRCIAMESSWLQDLEKLHAVKLRLTMAWLKLFSNWSIKWTKNV